VRDFPRIALNRSREAVPEAMKKSHRNTYSLQALSIREKWRLRKRHSKLNCKVNKF